MSRANLYVATNSPSSKIRCTCCRKSSWPRSPGVAVICPAAPIIGLLRKDPANPPARIGPVAAIPGDDMHMHVRHGLAGRHAIVDADVVSVRPQFRVQHRPHALQHRQHRALLVEAHLPERFHVPPRHDQAMATGNRVAVAQREHETLGNQQAGGVRYAKGAGFLHRCEV